MPLTAKQDESVFRLSDVIKKGCFQQVRFLVDIGIDLDERDGDKKTPLMLCSLMEPETWGVGIAQLFIEKGANLEAVDKYGMNALHYACVYDRIGLVKVLLNALDFDINQSDRMGNTALHYAARAGHAVIVYMLVGMLRRYKQSLDKTNNLGRTALHEANRLSREQCSDILQSVEQFSEYDLESNRSRSPFSLNLKIYRENITGNLSRCFSYRSSARSKKTTYGKREATMTSLSIAPFLRSQTLTDIYRKQPKKQLPPNKRDEGKLIRCASLSDFRNNLDYIFNLSPVELISTKSRTTTQLQLARPKTCFAQGNLQESDIEEMKFSWKTELKKLVKHYEYQCSSSYRPCAKIQQELPQLQEYKPVSPTIFEESGVDELDKGKDKKGRRSSSVCSKIGFANNDSVPLKKKTTIMPPKSKKISALTGANIKQSISAVDGSLASSNESLNSNVSTTKQTSGEATTTSPKTNSDKVNKAGGSIVAKNNAKKSDEQPGYATRTGAYTSLPTVTVVEEEADTNSEGSSSNPSTVDPNYLHVLSDIDEQ